MSANFRLNSRFLTSNVAAAFMAACLALAGPVSHAQTPSAGGKAPLLAQVDARPSVEVQRKQVQEQTQSSLDKEAMAAVTETRSALSAIVKKDKKEALAALERATGKVNILIARNAKAALIPVEFSVEVADTAPADVKAIKDLADACLDAVKDKRFSDARALLDTLRSEIRVRSLNLPLATYPGALMQAAKLVDEGKNDEASKVLTVALNTLAIVDKATAIPLVDLTEALKLADESAQKTDVKDKAEAAKQLTVATTALKRAEALGQVDQKSANEFQKHIDELDRKLKGKETTASAFAKLREKIASWFKRSSQAQSRGQTGK